MKMASQFRSRHSCSLCEQDSLPVTQCESGYVCDACAEKSRLGRDSTTQAAKTQQRALRGQATILRTQASGSAVDEQLDYETASSGMLAAEAFQQSSAVTLITGGEVTPRHDSQLRDTLTTPGVAALEASANRLELISKMGTDVAAMALDASDTIGANNSLEKMLAHQLAACHDSAMRNMSKAILEQDPVQAVRMMNLSARLMETYQKGLMTLKRLRGTGEQRITIQHVHVTEGGQAVIGNVKTGGGGSK